MFAVLSIIDYSGLNERQKKAIDFLKKNNSIKTSAYLGLNKVSFGTVRLDINEMIKLGYLEKTGKFRGAYYCLKNSNKKNQNSS